MAQTTPGTSDKERITPEAMFGGTNDAGDDSSSTFEPAPQGGETPPQGAGQDAQSQQPPQGGTQQTTPPTAAPVITPEMIRQAVEQGVQAGARMVQPQAPAQPPQITPEDQAAFDKQFNIVRMTPERFQAIMGVAPESAEQLKAMEAFAHDTSRQAIALATHVFNTRLAEVEARITGQVSPLLKTHSESTAKALQDEFIQSNPDLADHQALLVEIGNSTAAQVKAGNLKFASKAEVMTFVANKARQLLGKAAPTGQAPAKQQSQRRHNMTPTSVGGNPGSTSSPRAGNGVTISPQMVFGSSK